MTTGAPHGAFSKITDLPIPALHHRRHTIVVAANGWRFDDPATSYVSRRLSTDEDELTKASRIVRALDGAPQEFNATEILVATWHNAAYPHIFSYEVMFML